MTSKAFLQSVLIVFMATMLFACSSNDDGSGNATEVTATIESTKDKISGVVISSQVASASVQLIELGENNTESTTTNDSGVYIVELDETPESFRLTAEAEDTDSEGIQVIGTLSALYFDTDTTESYNLTYLTTLIDYLVTEDSGVDLFEKRKSVIARLVSLGILSSADDWFSLSPAGVDVTKLRMLVAESGSLESWLESVSEDLADDEISGELSDVFDHANGGIKDILFGQNNTITAFPGQDINQQIDVLVNTTDQMVAYKLIGAPDGMLVSDKGVISYQVDESQVAGESLLFTVEVTDSATGLSKTTQGTVYTIEKLNEVESQIQAGQDLVVANLNDTVKLSIDSSNVISAGSVSVIDGKDENNNPRTSIVFDENFEGKVEITRTPPNQSWALPQESEVADSSIGVEQRSTLLARNYPLANYWVRLEADFYGGDWEVGIGNRVSQNSQTLDISSTGKKQEIHFDREESSVLMSECAATDSACYTDKTPILFVHGFNPSTMGLGGGEGTWGDLPESLKTENPDYRTFEFRWVTATKFEDAAADLGKSIRLIAHSTGQKVHVVAHSFGGVLTRTYLQGLATAYPYGDDVASVSTVGSPHSGIFDKETTVNGIDFPKGQDGQFGWGLRWRDGVVVGVTGDKQIDFCGQITCYQMGEYVNFSQKDLDILDMNFSNSTELPFNQRTGRFIAEVADFTTNPLPDGLEIQVLIGLSASRGGNGVFDEGDGLISFEGQRISPAFKLAEYGTDMTGLGGLVTEKPLGFGQEIFPGDDFSYSTNGWRPGFFGFRHTAATGSNPASAIPEVNVNNECESLSDGCANSSDHPIISSVSHHIEIAGSQLYMGVSPILQSSGITYPSTEGDSIDLTTTNESLNSEQVEFLNRLIVEIDDADALEGNRINWHMLGDEKIDSLQRESVGLFAGYNQEVVDHMISLRTQWLNNQNSILTHDIDDSTIYFWEHSAGRKMIWDRLLLDAKASVGAVKVIYGATGKTIGPLTVKGSKLSEKLMTKALGRLSTYGNLLGCIDFVTAANNLLAENNSDNRTDFILKAGSCVSGFADESGNFSLLFSLGDSANSLSPTDAKKSAIALIDAANAVIGLLPPNPVSTVTTGLLEMTSALMSRGIVLDEYNESTSKEEWVVRDLILADYDKYKKDKMAFFSGKILEARLTGLYYVDSDGDDRSDFDDAFPDNANYQDDSDKDGLPDKWETLYGFDNSVDDANLDKEPDGLSNIREFTLGTNPDKKDTDGDGFDDALEVTLYSDPTQSDSIPPDATTNVIADFTSTNPLTLSVAWLGGEEDGYVICYGTTDLSEFDQGDIDVCGGFDNTKRQLVTGNSVDITEGLLVNQTYYIRVANNNEGITGLVSNLATAKFDAPTVPSNVKSVRNGETIELSWDSSVNTAGYKILLHDAPNIISEQSEAGLTYNPSATVIDTEGSTNSSLYLPDRETYYAVVVAYVDETLKYAAVSDEVELLGNVLAVPENITASRDSELVTVTWDAVTDATGYRIRYAKLSDSIESDAVTVADIEGNTEASLYLSENDQYHASVQAYGEDIGDSDWSETVLLPIPEIVIIRKLNDTGITQCANGYQNGLSCPVTDYPDQDAQYGRDAITNDDSDGSAGFSFTKLDSNGNELLANATEWSCVKDNVTGFTWEVKKGGNDIVGDEGLHDADDKYNWYSTDGSNNHGFEGYEDYSGAVCFGYNSNVSSSFCNTQGFVDRVNQVGLCGKKDWQLPAREDLLSLVDYGAGVHHINSYNPVGVLPIDADYFPGTKPGNYLSSSQYTRYSGYVWLVNFVVGSMEVDQKRSVGHVRLVSSGK